MTENRIKFQIWPALIAVVALIIFLTSIVYFVQAEARDKVDHLLGVATAALPEILPGDYQDRIFLPGAVSSVETAALEARLTQFSQRSGLQRIYTVQYGPDSRLYVTASSHVPGDTLDSQAAGLTVWDNPPKELTRAFESGRVEFMSSQSGRRIRTVAVRSGGHGHPVFLACADMDVSYVKKSLWRNGLIALVVVAAFAVLIGLLLRSSRKAAYMYGKLSELARANSELYKLASYDNLTGLLTRGKFFDLADAQLRNMTLVKSPGAVIMLDIDNFKKVNDIRGHAKGDEVLAAVAHVCRMSLRSYDLVGRYGGEEIIMLLVRVDAGLSEAVAERLRQSVAKLSFDDKNEDFSVSVTMGLASFSYPTESLDHYVHLADQQLLKGKESGKNRVCHTAL